MEVEVGISPQDRKRKLRHKTDRNVQLPDNSWQGATTTSASSRPPFQQVQGHDAQKPFHVPDIRSAPSRLEFPQVYGEREADPGLARQLLSLT